MSEMEELRNGLFEVLSACGAKLMGIADLSGVVPGRCSIGVAVAVPVPAVIVEELKNSPTLEYYDAYGILNARLDRIVEAGAGFLTAHGYKACANTTKTVKEDQFRRTRLPHKTVAAKAGLGWVGKNCLLVTQQYGCAVRLSSLVTDAPLHPDSPIETSRCGDCGVCVALCPANALSGALWFAGMPREQILDDEACEKTQLKRMKNATGIDVDLCGLCFAVCPYTQRYLDAEKRRNAQMHQD